MNKKIIGFFIGLVLLLIQLMPITLAVNLDNQTIKNNEELLEKGSVEEEKIDDSKLEDIEKEQSEPLVNKNEEIKTDANKAEEIKLKENKLEDIVLEKTIKGNDSEEIIEDFSLYTIISSNTIKPYFKDEKYYFFLPKGTDLSTLELNYTGNIETITTLEFDEKTKTIYGNFENEQEYTIGLKNGQEIKIVIMKSDVPAIFICLNDEIPLSTVNNESKDIKYEGIVSTIGCNKSKDNISEMPIEFKGRGNTSWSMPKKSYQIKLNKKTNFLGIGNSKEKKWVLIANYQDPTLLKNKIVNDLCVNMGLSNCPNSDFADLYVNGEYVGNYLVCDKIEIKDNRVNLTDEKGLLIELDNAYYYDEDYWFKSKQNNYYSVKEAVSEGNEEVLQEAINSFKEAIDTFQTELYSENTSWENICQMIDVESFAKYYLINEFTENTDSYYSSCFLYKNGDNDVIHMGPTWDYDSAFGYSKGVARGEDPEVDFTLKYAYMNDMQRLYIFPQFASLVNELYNSQLKPLLNEINVEEMSEKHKASTTINSFVWNSFNEYNNKKSYLNSFIEKRKNYYKNKYSNDKIEYTTHIQYKGWKHVKDSEISGTEGQSLRLEGFKATIGKGLGENSSILYRTHIQDIGWQDWKKDGELSGTTGKNLRLEAIQLKLNNANYSIRYRVHIQDIGWTGWAYDGEIAGTEGKSLRLEAIEIEIVEKRTYIGKQEINTNGLINYKAHIESIGDTGYSTDGEVIGTIGRSLRLEGLKLELGQSTPKNIRISINEHVQDIGWVYGLTDKDYIGTQGKSFRLEALSFKLNGEKSENYTIKYRAHVQNIGWQEWKQDGEIAGTEGQALRIEAIQILIEPK